MTSRDDPLIFPDNSKDREGRTTTGSTRRSKSHRRGESVAHSQSIHNSEDILDKRMKEIEEGDRQALVVHKKVPSRGRRSRSPTPRRYEASPRKRRSRSKSQTPERRRAFSRKRRSRSRSPTKEEETRKHHRDRYERSDANWAKVTSRKTKKLEDRTMTAREAAWKALSNIAASPFARRLQEARLPSRVKHSTFILYETNADPVAHI
ncbi:uncharacterized protein LOC131317494 [Rhododendron vialii]|uniref:uncharacterized protein LOC131317494 n=1 Tax=Rhododendron vialii TaxID=182163 RepID=UPI00266007C2|nr:uncharacterized protein LOC131317494 [Rhododendron vialii]